VTDQPKLFEIGDFGRLESDDPGFYQKKGLAAGSDPNSRAAFDKLEKSKKLTGMRLAIYEALSAWGEMSPHEVARFLDLDIVTVRARITELFNDRYIKRLDFKRKTPSGNMAYVYVVKK
jgi:DNA-binding transcriptional ArsR family regulator